MSSKVYASVKSYSKRGRLLQRADLQTLAESRDLDELMTRIKNTTFADAVSDIQKPFTSQKIESALRSSLADMHYSIARTAADANIFRAYYMKFIVLNLKLVLKGKVLGKPQEDIEAHINLHAEELIKQRDIVVKALAAKDLEEAVANLNSTEFGEEIAKAAAIYNDKKNIQIFDIYFDKILYQQLGNARKNTRDLDAGKLIGLEIDFYNILSVIRGKFWGLDEQQIQDLIVAETPSAPSELLGRMMTVATVRDSINELSNSKYKNLIPQAEDELDALAEIERAFELQIYNSAKNAFTKMFSFVTTIGIIKLTEFEIRNLSAIAYAVEQGIPTDTTMTKLILDEE